MNRSARSFEPTDGVREVQLDPEGDKDKIVKVGVILTPKSEGALVDFLRDNSDVFAWKPSDMPGIPREVAEHSLNTRPSSKPIKQ